MADIGMIFRQQMREIGRHVSQTPQTHGLFPVRHQPFEDVVHRRGQRQAPLDVAVALDAELPVVVEVGEAQTVSGLINVEFGESVPDQDLIFSAVSGNVTVRVPAARKASASGRLIFRMSRPYRCGVAAAAGKAAAPTLSRSRRRCAWPNAAPAAPT